MLGLAATSGEAFFKAQEATQSKLPTEGSVLISVNDRDKAELNDLAKAFKENGFKIYATTGTAEQLKEAGIDAEVTQKIFEGRPNLRDLLVNDEIQLMINTPSGKESVHNDSYVRQSAIKAKIPYMTTMAAAKATAEGIHEVRTRQLDVKSLQDWHAEIKEKE